MKRILLWILIPVFLFAFQDAFAEGPPGKEKARSKGDEATDFKPFPSSDEIAKRFEKEWGIKSDFFHQVEESFEGKFTSESASEKGGEQSEEKIMRNTVLVLLLSIAEVSGLEREKKAKPEERNQNLKKASDIMIDRLRTSGVGWGDLAHEVGIDGTNQLMSLQRAILWEDEIPEVAKPLLTFPQPETAK